jgi:DNA transformation protein
MSIDEGLYAWVQEALEPMGNVTMRKMMGGATLYLDGIIFAIMVDGEIWMKSDAEADAIWDTVSTERFSVTFKDGSVDMMNYRRAPSDVYDDAEAMQKWVSVSVEAGRRRVVKKRPKRDAAANAARSRGSPRSS